jgi:4-alpha-glucanotransferase
MMAVAIHRYIARTPSRLAVVQLEDAAGAIEQANLPGTHREHPNWQRKLPVELNPLFESSRLQALAAAMREERPATWATR